MRFIALLITCLFAFSAHAATTPWAKLDNADIRVIYGMDEAGAPRAAIHIKLDDGWKTYWRTSGDAGLPVVADTAKSENLKSSEIIWPAPTRYLDFGELQSFGYKHEVLLPLTLTPQNPAAPIALNMNVKFAVCKELCLMLEQPFALKLDNKTRLTEEEKVKIAEAEALVPAAHSAQSDITVHSVALREDGNFIHVEITSAKPFETPDLLIEAGAAFRFLEPEITLSEGGKRAVIFAPVQQLMSDKTIIGKEVTFTLADKGRGVEWKTTLTKQSGKAYDTGFFLVMLGFAVLGGLILNIMPCVLPVLSLKVLSMLKKSGKELKTVRRSFLISSAGILFSFMLLAALVVSLQMAGKTVGWGFQFQEPYFLIVLALILTFFAANLFGLFELQLPHGINNWIHHKAGGKQGYTEHFLTGAFATLMATPCSAPFLGTAIGFAFSQGALETFALFFAMGIGLSIPYLVFAAFPELVRVFPKPGAWMVKAKAILGGLLLLTAAWVIWVLAAQKGVLISAAVGALVLLIIAAFKLPVQYRRKPIIALVIACLLIPLAFKHTEAPHEKTGLWQPFERDAIATHVAQGKRVVVDVTADWCLTCKANKIFVWNTSEIVDVLKEPDVITMKADWTNRSLEIADYLKSFGRYGIPFNVIYGPNAPDGIALPELLRKDLVIDALEKAKKRDEKLLADPRPPELP